MSLQPTVIDELQEAITSGSDEKRIETLRRITDLFLSQADRLNDAQVELFDDVLKHFVDRIESKTLAELSGRLAPIANAPEDLVRKLAWHDEVAVAGPVLTSSPRLTTVDLVQIAQTRGQEHLLAISGRESLDSSLTDVLLVRGNNDVLHKVASNPGSKISPAGFQALVRASEEDDRLAETTGMRQDIPVAQLRELMMKAAEAVRLKLLAEAPAHDRTEIDRVISGVTDQLTAEQVKPRDYSSAIRYVNSLQDAGKIDEFALFEFATTKKIELTVATLALLSKCSLELIKPLMQSTRPEGLLVPCKAVDLRWLTVKALVECRPTAALSSEQLSHLEAEFDKLTKPSAERMLRFWKVREASSKPAAASA